MPVPGSGALSFLPGILVIAFKTGPFAWNGVIAFWIPLSIFGTWFFVMAWVMLQALKDDESHLEEDPVTTDSTPA